MVTTAYNEDDRMRAPVVAPVLSANSAVSWAAILAGALAAAVLSLLLFLLGIGLGLSSISVWSGQGADGETIGWAAIFWLAFTQLASAGVGGYIAGRLRTKWQGIHSDEVYFRDTAHGFLSWAFATLLMVAVMGSIAGAAITGTVKAAGAVASGAAQVAGGAASAAVTGAAGATVGKMSEQGSDLNYWVGSLLRNGGPTQSQKEEIRDGTQNMARKAQSAVDEAKEVSGVFMHSLEVGALSDEDSRYLAQLVAQRTDLTQEEAQQKVQQSFEQVKQQVDKAKAAAKEAEEKAKIAAEQARKATAYSMLWMFVALLIGAFVGSLSATVGGRQRDA